MGRSNGLQLRETWVPWSFCAARNVEGLKQGIYFYQAAEHTLAAFRICSRTKSKRQYISSALLRRSWRENLPLRNRQIAIACSKKIQRVQIREGERADDRPYEWCVLNDQGRPPIRL
jgi:hypothetical protein